MVWRVSLVAGLLLSGVVTSRVAREDGAAARAPACVPVGTADRARTHVRVALAESLAVLVPSAVCADAPRVVLLPGVVGSAFSMRHVVAGLEGRGIGVLVIDPLGMGASSRPSDADYSLEAQAVRVLAVLDSLAWPRSVLVGQGTSATIALRAAARAPARASAIGSIAGGPVASQHTEGVRTALRFGRLLNTPPGRALARRHFARELRARAVQPNWITPDIERAYVAPLLDDVPRALRAMQGMRTATEPVPLEQVLEHVQAPVRVFVGRVARPGAPTDVQLALLRRFVRDVRIDSLEATGVLLHEEVPDVLARELAKLARDRSAAPSR